MLNGPAGTLCRASMPLCHCSRVSFLFLPSIMLLTLTEGIFNLDRLQCYTTLLPRHHMEDTVHYQRHTCTRSTGVQRPPQTPTTTCRCCERPPVWLSCSPEMPATAANTEQECQTRGRLQHLHVVVGVLGVPRCRRHQQMVTTNGGRGGEDPTEDVLGFHQTGGIQTGEES